MNLLKIVSIVLFVTYFLFACSAQVDSDIVPNKLTPEALLEQSPLFLDGYQKFELSLLEKQQILLWPKNIVIAAYFGLWCHDSQREVPKILRIAEANSELNIVLLTLGADKKDQKGLASLNKIKYTPTFIIYRGKNEIGRIVERPKQSFVDDIRKMIN